MICFGFWRIFWRKIVKEQTGKSGHIGLLRHSVGNPRRGLNLRCRWDACYAVAMLCHGVATVHNEQISIFVFEHLVLVHRQFKDPNK